MLTSDRLAARRICKTSQTQTFAQDKPIGSPTRNEMRIIARPTYIVGEQ
jgi:hypothetical protein